MKKLIKVILVVGLLLLTAGTTFANSSLYTAVDMGNFFGRAINNKHEIVGRTEPGYISYLRSSDGTLTHIPSLSGPSYTTSAIDINNSGEVVGMDRLYPFKWSRSTGTQRLFYDSNEKSFPYAVNDHGVSAGLYINHDKTCAALWEADGSRTLISQVSPSEAKDINNTGQVVGRIDSNGFLWTEQGEAISLGQLMPEAINNNGLVIGNINSLESAYTWTANEGLSLLPRQPEWISSAAYHVNDLGQIVGSARLGDYTYRAILWNPNGSIVDLGSYVHFDFRGIRISGNGEILIGSTLLVPIPEPSSAAVMLSALAGLTGTIITRRRRD